MSIKEILTKIEKVGYKALSKEEKSLIDYWVKKSPRVLWEFEAAKLTFTENRIVENWKKRKAV
jgi:hypothetical protein